jgi:hypothetical protein
MAHKRRKKTEKRHVNQKAVYIHKSISHNKGKYFTMDIDKTLLAMRKLSEKAFKMYVYLCTNTNEHSILLSQSKFCKATGMSENTYTAAKQELIDNKYLHIREDGDYDFYNYPFKPITKKDEIMSQILDKIKQENETEENCN